MERVFVDTDIIIDLLAERQPYFSDAAKLFSAADRKKIRISVSSLSFANVHYLLSKELGKNNARKKLAAFKTLVNVLPVDDKTVDLALASDFSDFEDGLQYFTAIESNIKTLLTRNLKDFKTASISIMTASQFMKTRT